jgi:EpsI family protein
VTSRRDFLIGSLLLAASGGAYALTPRRKLALLESSTLETMIPRRFGEWTEVPSGALVVPQGDDSLAARLYSQTVGRVYINPDNEYMMMLIAYGDTQSDQLQLHRPEVCYPAFGFELQDVQRADIAVADGVSVPGRRMTATSDLRDEHILYWARIGELLPASGSEQRWMRLKTEMQGIIPDGVLVRFSNIRPDPSAGFLLNQRFAADLVQAISPGARRALLGTDLARKLST